LSQRHLTLLNNEELRHCVVKQSPRRIPSERAFATRAHSYYF